MYQRLLLYYDLFHDNQPGTDDKNTSEVYILKGPDDREDVYADTDRKEAPAPWGCQEPGQNLLAFFSKITFNDVTIFFKRCNYFCMFELQ